ncbi:Unannotated [Lentimonas sp. CC4]|uniref:hypothetical protein n=2 Tax=unclassified Lentimonas TaxID=2630993 RepID=UPI00132B005C|nr:MULTISPECIES: hypothetical protein [unclassified Lentimonas]CAA6687396.1 Unannotated [Lentimonas sp. CC6]CAA7172142.1 Unannotated [Lentimonas sp. CC21]CAA6680168.1 Unannotated [Lentimonas sp. CC4]CAA7076050.1 Unannotated [Lentimonas sp. CC4]CAA7181101.1 Unannotated [Lentimonas sp. CC8]
MPQNLLLFIPRMKRYLVLLLASACYLPADDGTFGDYPIVSHFKRISWESIDELMHLDQVIVHTAKHQNYRQNEALALEFKRRKPEARVLLQYYWNAFPRTRPKQAVYAQHGDHYYDEDYYPYPDFNGYFLATYPRTFHENIASNEETFTLTFDAIPPLWKKYMQQAAAQKRVRKPYLEALVYALDDAGHPDYTQSEFLQVLKIEMHTKRVTFRRLPQVGQQGWHAYAAGKSQLGFQTKFAKYENLWVLNGSKFGPRDPKTGMNGAEYVAKHLADYYRKCISGLDGFSFDVPTFAPHEGTDINADGIVDHGYIDGINAHGIGMRDIFEYLKFGSDFDAGLGENLLIVQDGGWMGDQRFPGLINGAENEDFPGIQQWDELSENINMHLWWCDHAQPPNISFNAMRFPTDAYHNPEYTNKLEYFMHNNYARLGMAVACMGNGVCVYEASRAWIPKSNNAWDRTLHIADAEIVGDTAKPYVLAKNQYPWDEYNAGSLQRYRWLGQPLEDRVYHSNHLGDELLSYAHFTKLSPEIADTTVKTIDFQVNPELSALSYDVVFTELPHNAWKTSSLTKGYARAAMVTLKTPEVLGDVKKGEEFTIQYIGKGHPYYDRFGEKYRDIPLPIGFRLVVNGQPGKQQWGLLIRNGDTTRLTLTAPASGSMQLEILSGAEQGHVALTHLSLRKGCAEVMHRRFENGLVLLNTSKHDNILFDIHSIDPSHTYRRIEGLVDPDWNDGSQIGNEILLPAREALFLVKNEP